MEKERRKLFLFFSRAGHLVSCVFACEPNPFLMRAGSRDGGLRLQQE